mgnify:CR=1 FL=1
MMANNWNIPDWLETEIRERDKKCVYCGVEFTPTSVAPIIKQAVSNGQ